MDMICTAGRHDQGFMG